MWSRPEKSEYADYYHRYVNRVPEGNILDIIAGQIGETVRWLGSIQEDKAMFRYAPGKWSVKGVVGHLIDIERLFQYRVLAFARLDPARLPGMEQDDYAAAANYDVRALSDIVDEYQVTREAGLALFRSFDSNIVMRKGVANEVEFTVRSVPYILAGHDTHHTGVIKELYL